MNAVLNVVLSITAITLMGCLCGFLVFLNYVKQEEKKKENEDGEINR